MRETKLHFSGLGFIKAGVERKPLTFSSADAKITRRGVSRISHYSIIRDLTSSASLRVQGEEWHMSGCCAYVWILTFLKMNSPVSDARVISTMIGRKDTQTAAAARLQLCSWHRSRVNTNSWRIHILPSLPQQGAHVTYRLFTHLAGQDSQAHSKSA